MIFSPNFDFDFLSTCQEIGWEENLRYDLPSVEWDVKPNLISQRTEMQISGKVIVLRLISYVYKANRFRNNNKSFPVRTLVVFHFP